MKRITIKNLENLVGHLNKLTDNPAEPYTIFHGTSCDAPGEYKANVGAYLISRAYGRYALHQMDNDKGGERDVLSSGHVPARELFNLIHAYLRGMEAQGLYK
jgi:hypothetical protein